MDDKRDRDSWKKMKGQSNEESNRKQQRVIKVTGAKIEKRERNRVKRRRGQKKEEIKIKNNTNEGKKKRKIQSEG